MLMSAVTDAMGHLSVLAGAAVTIAMALNALASVLRVWIEQSSRTRRLDRALDKSEPSERSEIIEACSKLESGFATGVRDDRRNESSFTDDGRELPSREAQA